MATITNNNKYIEVHFKKYKYTNLNFHWRANMQNVVHYYPLSKDGLLLWSLTKDAFIKRNFYISTFENNNVIRYGGVHKLTDLSSMWLNKSNDEQKKWIHDRIGEFAAIGSSIYTIGLYPKMKDLQYWTNNGYYPTIDEDFLIEDPNIEKYFYDEIVKFPPNDLKRSFPKAILNDQEIELKTFLEIEGEKFTLNTINDLHKNIPRMPSISYEKHILPIIFNQKPNSKAAIHFDRNLIRKYNYTIPELRVIMSYLDLGGFPKMKKNDIEKALNDSIGKLTQEVLRLITFFVALVKYLDIDSPSLQQIAKIVKFLLKKKQSNKNPILLFFDDEINKYHSDLKVFLMDNNNTDILTEISKYISEPSEYDPKPTSYKTKIKTTMQEKGTLLKPSMPLASSTKLKFETAFTLKKLQQLYDINLRFFKEVLFKESKLLYAYTMGSYNQFALRDVIDHGEVERKTPELLTKKHTNITITLPNIRQANINKGHFSRIVEKKTMKYFYQDNPMTNYIELTNKFIYESHLKKTNFFSDNKFNIPNDIYFYRGINMENNAERIILGILPHSWTQTIKTAITYVLDSVYGRRHHIILKIKVTPKLRYIMLGSNPLNIINNSKEGKKEEYEELGSSKNKYEVVMHACVYKKVGVMYPAKASDIEPYNKELDDYNYSINVLHANKVMIQEVEIDSFIKLSANNDLNELKYTLSCELELERKNKNKPSKSK